MRAQKAGFMRLALLTVLGLAALAAPSATQISGAHAVPAVICGERNQIVNKLISDFDEQQEDLVLRSERSLMELFASNEGTWTILHTSPSGRSCLVASGRGLAPIIQL